jgi:hypothetical protein
MLMSQADSSSSLRPPTAGEPLEYRALSGMAVGGLLLGVLSVSALAGQALWGVPLVGAIVSLVALARINRSQGDLTGRTAALAGLALSVFFGTIAPAQFLSNERMLANRAEEVARQWFDALAHGEPTVAKQLCLAPRQRARLADSNELWAYYRQLPEQRKELTQFVGEPLVRALLALGDRATVRLYETAGVGVGDEQAAVAQVYAVTYDDHGRRKTFFVDLTIERNISRGPNKADWRIIKYAGGGNPL